VVKEEGIDASEALRIDLRKGKSYGAKGSFSEDDSHPRFDYI
jgi:hypothetical protein